MLLILEPLSTRLPAEPLAGTGMHAKLHRMIKLLDEPAMPVPSNSWYAHLAPDRRPRAPKLRSGVPLAQLANQSLLDTHAAPANGANSIRSKA